jgi:hypothetical protein
MLDINNGLALFVKDHRNGTPDLLCLWINEAEGGLVREHDGLQNANFILSILAMRRGFLVVHREGSLSLFWHMCCMLLIEMLANLRTPPPTLWQIWTDGEKCDGTGSCLVQSFSSLAGQIAFQAAV